MIVVQSRWRVVLFGMTAFTAVAPATPGRARVLSIVIDATVPAFGGAAIGTAGAYETLNGRVFGELDPRDPHNKVIQDIGLADRAADGNVPYIATFRITKPVDMSRSSGLLIDEIPNRGGGAIPTAAADVTPGAVYLESGWQGDLLSQCTSSYPCTSLTTPYSGTNLPIQVPVAHEAGGATITGPVYGHVADASGSTAQLVIFTTPVPYKPATLSTAGVRFWSLASQTITGVDGPKTPIAPGDWAWADCRTTPFPGTPDPTRVCLRNGFNPDLLYEMVFTAKDPLVLGVGYAATRDTISFFRHRAADDHGTANPLGSHVSTVLINGVSQSASFIRSGIGLGFNEDEEGRRVADGAWSQIDGRQLYLNIRFALPDVITNLYMPADEGPVWWADYPDLARHTGPEGLLDRCTASGTCPEILETFGSLEFYEEKMSPDLIGFTASGDVPLPRNVHRYYFPATTHGGGAGGFDEVSNPPPASGCTLPVNPNPETDTANALLDDFVALLMHGTPMPPSVYPTLANRQLVPATAAAEGFPTIPGYPFLGDRINHPEVFRFGPRLDTTDDSGIVDRQPPVVSAVLPAYAPRVDGDGNELSGVPSVLLLAPLATYTGWNTYASGIYAGQQCGLTASSFPLIETKTARLASSDPRPSLEERYGTHDGYACAVHLAAKLSADARLLRATEVDVDTTAAQAGNVLAGVTPSRDDQARGEALCRAAGLVR